MIGMGGLAAVERDRKVAHISMYSRLLNLRIFGPAQRNSQANRKAVNENKCLQTKLYEIDGHVLSFNL